MRRTIAVALFGLVALSACQRTEEVSPAPVLIAPTPVAVEQARFVPSRPGFLWEVKGPAGKVYLLGEVRVLDESFYPLPDYIEQAFREAESLGLALSSDDEGKARMKAVISNVGLYPPGDGLSMHLSRDVSQLMRSTLTARGLTTTALEKSHPWLARVVIHEASLQVEGAVAELQLFRHFQDATQGKKPIVGIMTAEEAVRTMSEYPGADTDEAVRVEVEEYDFNGPDDMATQKAWSHGSLEELLAVTFAAEKRRPAVIPMNKVMVATETGFVVPRLSQILASGKTHFVVLSSAMLVLPGGILDGLRARGFTVTRL